MTIKSIKFFIIFTFLLANNSILAAENLYSDEWVLGCARIPIDRNVNESNHILDVVENGETLEIHKIFNKLNINVEKIIFKEKSTINMVDFYIWNISPSYTISIMVANNDVTNSNKKIGELLGYGVRITHK